MDKRQGGGEEDLVQRYLAPLAAGFPGAFGLTDDCAALAPPPGHHLVVTTDPVVAGLHFAHGEPSDAIAWKALAVNVSDLAAKGAAPLAYLMALALPSPPEAPWLAGFADGLRRAQARFGCHLAGGDLDRTPGPLTVAITAFGLVPAGAMVLRSTARAGDAVYVTGTIGDAALGLRLGRCSELAQAWGLDESQRQYLIRRQVMPSPVVGCHDLLRAYATSAIDVSDGLVKDFERLCRASGAGGRIDASRVPLSQAARAVLARRGMALCNLLAGGEDYEILFTVPEAQAEELESAASERSLIVTRIGEISAEPGVAIIDSSGSPHVLSRTGWDHF